MTVSLLSLDSQGNWIEVAGKSPVKTSSDGSYRFDGLIPATYRIQETLPSNFLDGKATVGTVGGTTKGTAGTDQLEIQLGPGENGSEYNFSVLGLRPNLISLRLFLASTPPTDQLLQQFLNSKTTPALAAAAVTGITTASPAATIVGNSLPLSRPVSAAPALAVVTNTNPSSASSGNLISNSSSLASASAADHAIQPLDSQAVGALAGSGSGSSATANVSATASVGNALPQTSPASATPASTTNASSGNTGMSTVNTSNSSATAPRAKTVVSARAMLASVDLALQQSHNWLQA